MRLVAVMVGGTVGALARWALLLAIPSVQGFPLSTFLINITGAFGLGLVGVLLLERLPPHPLSASPHHDRVLRGLYHVLNDGHGRGAAVG